MTTINNTPPADSESAALDFFVRIAEALPGGASAMRAALHNFAGALHIDGALAGLTTIGDARLAAATIAEAAVTADDPVGALRIRAAAVRAGCAAQQCSNPAGLAQALDVAATVLDLM